MSTGDTQTPGATVTPRPSHIAWTALALMTVSSVASLRPAPTMTVYGRRACSSTRCRRSCS